MQPSNELVALTQRSLEAFASGDPDRFFAQRISQQEGVLAIATDPNEWWSGHEKITELFKAQSEAMQGISITNSAPLAYSEGTVGWIADRPTLRLPDGTDLPFRLTIVYHQEEGQWRIVQWHASLGVANEVTFGEELPT
ncbi:MAG TPA: nuclear transport factor 2 family protein [Anaerolineae bacterium]|nr:nuclear transport factor 2 family protein [Anaerolineae bacterium]HMR63919.1 nuclear transport factor 2 family protein [Anaerolineae bacterium]